MSKRKPPIEMIPIEKIHILNPRVRNTRIFESIKHNITQVGLKRPITVTASSSVEGKEYDLVCGQGRIEAFMASSQTHIPAIVIDATEEQALIMSLVENCARRYYRAMDLLQGIEILQRQGYDDKAIAAKTGLTLDYTRGVIHLLAHGEERLLAAVESGQIPITIAIKIAETPGGRAIQQALQEAYDSHQLRGKKFLEAKRLVELRRHDGKTLNKYRKSKRDGETLAQDIIRVYQREVTRKRLLTRKANVASRAVVFVVEALRRLISEKGFQTILQTEGLGTLPKPISELIAGKA